MKGVFQVFLMNVEAIPNVDLDFYTRVISEWKLDMCMREDWVHPCIFVHEKTAFWAGIYKYC